MWHDVRDVMQFFEPDELLEHGLVDDALGAEPGSGAFVVGYCTEPIPPGSTCSTSSSVMGRSMSFCTYPGIFPTRTRLSAQHEPCSSGMRPLPRSGRRSATWSRWRSGILRRANPSSMDRRLHVLRSDRERGRESPQSAAAHGRCGRLRWSSASSQRTSRSRTTTCGFRKTASRKRRCAPSRIARSRAGLSGATRPRHVRRGWLT